MLCGFECTEVVSPRLRGTYQIVLPSAFAKLVSLISFVKFDFSGTIALRCALEADAGYYTQWWFAMLTPILFGGLAVLLGKAECMRTEAQVHYVSVMFFLLYPSLSQRVYSLYDCHDLDTEESWLRDDYFVDCNDSSHTVHQAVGFVFMALYPIGVPIGFLYLLRTSKQALHDPTHPEHQKRNDMYGFVTDDYIQECYWWETAELSKKLILTAVMMFIRRGTVVQLLIALIIGGAYAGVGMWKQPFRNRWNNILKSVVDTQIVIVLAVLLAVKATEADSTAENIGVSRYTFGYILVVVSVVLPLPPIALMLYELFSGCGEGKTDGELRTSEMEFGDVVDDNPLNDEEEEEEEEEEEAAAAAAAGAAEEEQDDEEKNSERS
jgi:hypothetical protein